MFGSKHSPSRRYRSPVKTIMAMNHPYELCRMRTWILVQMISFTMPTSVSRVQYIIKNQIEMDQKTTNLKGKSSKAWRKSKSPILKI
jgi:hypothetical protein